MKNYETIQYVIPGLWVSRDHYKVYRSYDGYCYYCTTDSDTFDLKQLNLFTINKKIIIDDYPKIVGDLPPKKFFLRRAYESLFKK